MQLKTFPLLYALLLFALQPTDANNSNNYSSLNNYHLHFKNNPQLIMYYYGHQSKPFNSDTDGDGVEDFYDLDDDNDGILDTDEGDDSIDTDGDGIPDYLDTDSDGDGCSDAKEAGFTDADSDGTVDGTGINADGIVTGSDGYTTPNDTNNNGIPDYIESNYYGVCIPNANAGNNRAICLNETTQLGDVANPGSSYQWTSVPNDPSISDPFISNPFVSPTVSTIYTLTETGLNGGVNSNDVEVIVNPLPNATVIADATVCENGSIAIGAPAIGGHSYSWSSIPAGFNSTQANPTLTATELTVTREYILTETIDVTGCQNQNSVIITVEELPSINAGPPSDTICASQTTYVLDQATGPLTNVSYTWTAIGSNGSFTPSANVLNPTFNPDPQDILNGNVNLQLTATATGNCSATPVQSSLQLFITPEPTADAGSDVTICSNDTYQINGTSTNGDINWTSSGSANTLDAYNVNDPTYTPSPQDITVGFVDLTMTVTPLTPCSTSAVGVIRISLTEEPEITINSGFIICEDQNVSLTSTITNASQIIWSTSGNGVFIPENGLNTQNPVYVPGSIDIQNGNVTLTVSATGIGECAATTTNQTLVTIIGNPVIDAGTAGSMCEGINPLITASAVNYDTLLWESPGGGTFSDDTIPNPTYQPSAAELSSGTATLRLTATPLTPCGITVVDEVTYSVFPAPQVNAGGDFEICESDNLSFPITTSSASNYESIQWTSSTGGTFNFNDIEQPTYFPSVTDITNGSVQLTLTATQGSCAVISDDMVLTIVKNPTVQAGNDITICQGDTAFINAILTDYESVAWTKMGGNGILIDSNTPNPRYESTPSDVGPIMLTCEVQPKSANGVPCGSPVTDFMTIYIEPSPLADAGLDQTICEGEDFQFTPGSVTASNFSSISWTSVGDSTGIFTLSETNDLSPTYTPGNDAIAAGFVFLRLTAFPNGNCALPVVAEMKLNITKVPFVDAGGDVTICSNDTYQINGTSTNGSVNWTSSGSAGTLNAYNINNPIYTPSPQDIIDGFVDLTMTVSPLSPCSSNAVSVIRISLTEEPEITINSDFNICEDQNVSLTSTITNASQIIWSTPGDGVFIPEDGLNTQNPVYDLGPLDIQNGNVTLTVSATGIGECADTTTDQTLVTIICNPVIDTDGDGIKDDEDVDADNDGIYNTYEGDDTIDTDGDGIPDYKDIDSDGDGCTDAKEAGFTDADGDGVVDGTGIAADGTVSGSDGYGYLADIDNSNVPDFLESSINICYVDDDNDDDGIKDDEDVDADNDGIYNTYEGDDTIDTDGDGIPDYKDIDSDGDGCNDAKEAGFTDNDNDGEVDGTGINANGIVTGSDGYGFPVDIDNNGIPDYKDGNYNGVCALINVGPDFNVCQGNPIQLTATSASNFNSISWNTTGDGVFTNSTTINPDYIPGPSDIANGFVNLTAIVSGVSQNTASDSLIVTILQNDFLNLISNNDNQIVCSSDPIGEIKYETNATEISVVGLPNGVNASLINNIVTISGSPTHVTNQTVYNYEIITAVNACASAAVEGQITVNPNDTITLSSVVGTNNQLNICSGATIDPIIYDIGGSATTASIIWNPPNGQPSGVTFDTATLTISGTISNAISTNTTYSYTITTGGSLCYTASANGSINVNPQCEAQIELNGTVTAKNNQIKDIATPTDAQDAATKSYVDNVLTNLGTLSDDFTGLSDMVQQLQQIINQLQQEVNDLKEQLNNSKK